VDQGRLRGRWTAGSARADDALLAAGVAVFGVVGTVGAAAEQPAARPLDAAAWALLLVASWALLARRRQPLAVLALTAAATVVWLAAAYPYGPVFLPLSLAVYTLATVTPGTRLPALAGGVAALLVLLVALGVADGGSWRREELPGVLLAWLALLGVPLWVGVVARSRRERAAEQARRRADDERLRVARELHDVVSHSIAMINFRAGVALHVLDRRPEQAREALTAIRQASAGALQELRATLGVLRQPAGGERSQASLPGLAQLEELVAGAGPPVAVVVDGEPAELPPAVDLAAYRVVQESLTNVVRHAGGARATVRVAFGPADLVVEVTDDGAGAPRAARSAGAPPRGPSPQGSPGPPGPDPSATRFTGAPPWGSPDPSGSGHGIAGMRERVAALGGELQAGPGPRGGFRVRARLPLVGPQGDAGGAAP
jgi:signal transduction histidine kinase